MDKTVELALDVIAGYPLYASTSGVTGVEAIKIAEIIEPDHNKWQDLIN